MNSRIGQWALLALWMTLPLHASIAGAVIDRNGHPISGCQVAAYAIEAHAHRLARLLDGGPRTPMAAGDTNQTGKFTLADTNQPFVSIEVHCAGWMPLSTRVRGSRSETGALSLIPAAVTSGRVLADQGPVSGARVTFFVEDGPEFTTETGAGGEYSTPDPRVWARALLVVHPSFATRATTWNRGDPPITQTLTLERATEPAKRSRQASSIVSGIVSDSLTRKPIAGLELHVLDPPNHVAASAITREDGSFRFDQATDSDSILIVSALPDYRLERRIARPEYAKPLQLQAVPTATVSGEVLGPDGKDIAGAFVSTILQSTDADELAAATVTYTGTDGRFVLRGLGPSARIQAEHPLFLPASSEMLTLRPGEWRSRIALRLEALARLGGLVLEHGTLPVDDVLVTLHPTSSFQKSGVQGSIRTDEHGVFDVRLRPGTYDVTLEKNGFVSVRRENVLVEPGENRLDLTIERSARISGRVVRTTSGSGVSGVSVSIEGSPASAVVTDAGGSFTLAGAEGRTLLTVSKTDELLRTTREINSPDTSVIIEIPEPRVLRGRVLDASSGQPIEHFLLETRLEDSANHAGASDVSRQSGGAFTVGLPPSGNVSLTVSADGFVTASRVVSKDQDDLEFALEAGSQLDGRAISKDGEPLAEVTALVRGASQSASTTTNAKGEFTLAALPAGPAHVTFTKSGFRATDRQLLLPHTGTLEVVMTPASVARGRVADDSDRPLGGCLIEILTQGSSVPRSTANSDRDGRFAFDGIDDGLYVVRISKPGYVTDIREWRIVAGTERQIMLRRGGRISGRVTGLSPAELSRARVIAEGSGTELIVSVGPDGRFFLDGLPKGTLSLVAEVITSAGSRTTEVVTVEADGNDAETVELRFPK